MQVKSERKVFKIRYLFIANRVRRFVVGASAFPTLSMPNSDATTACSGARTPRVPIGQFAAETEGNVYYLEITKVLLSYHDMASVYDHAIRNGITYVRISFGDYIRDTAITNLCVELTFRVDCN